MIFYFHYLSVDCAFSYLVFNLGIQDVDVLTIDRRELDDYSFSSYWRRTSEDLSIGEGVH